MGSPRHGSFASSSPLPEGSVGTLRSMFGPSELLASMDVLQSAKVLPLAIMSVRDLTELESAVENGRAADEILTDWRINGPGFSFEQMLVQRRIPLNRSKWVQDTAMRTVDDFVARIEAHRIKLGSAGCHVPAPGATSLRHSARKRTSVPRTRIPLLRERDAEIRALGPSRCDSSLSEPSIHFSPTRHYRHCRRV